MNLQFDAQFTPEDYLEAQRLHLGPWLFVTLVVLAVLLLILVPAALLCLDIFDWRVWLGCCAGVLLWAILVPMRFRRAYARRVKKSFEQRKDLQLPYNLSISDEHMVVASPERGGWTSQWSDFHKWKANDKIILLYLGSRLFKFLPRRWFASDADFASLKEFLARTIGPMGKARKLEPASKK